MATIDNRSPMPHLWFEKTGPQGESYDVLVVRGTFDFAADGGHATPSAEQYPIVYGDEYDGPVEENPFKAILSREGDLLLGKPSTDVYLTGTARTEGGRLLESWLATLKVGPLRKTLKLYGPRRFQRSLLGWKLSSPEPVAEVPLDYRHAFGGSFKVAVGDNPPEFAYKADNPAGCGWLPSHEELNQLTAAARKQLKKELGAIKELDAPQIEAPGKPVRYPQQRRDAQGFGPMARWYWQRQQYAGTYDKAWEKNRSPLLPEDFDMRFYQSAPPDQISKNNYLQGDETLTLQGLLPEGDVSMKLPAIYVLASVVYASGRRQPGRLMLDTVGIDLNVRRISLVWRALFDRNDPAERIAMLPLSLSSEKNPNG